MANADPLFIRAGSYKEYCAWKKENLALLDRAVYLSHEMLVRGFTLTPENVICFGEYQRHPRAAQINVAIVVATRPKKKSTEFWPSADNNSKDDR